MSREENRKNMPTVTAWVDQMRALYGQDCKVTYACENGIELGEKPVEGLDVGLIPGVVEIENAKIRETQRRKPRRN